MSLGNPRRIAQIDVLRGYAVLGMFWVDVLAFGLPYAANALPTLLGTPSELNLALWAGTTVFLEGAIRGLFSLLFGASALVFLEGARLGTGGLDLVDRFYRRNLLLLLFGLVHAYLLLWPHEVLYAYGLLGLFIFPLRKTPALVLLLAGIALQSVAQVEIDWAWVAGLLGGPSAASGLGEGASALSGPSSAPEESARFLSWLRLQMEQDIHTYRSGYLEIFLAQAPEVAAQQSTFFYKRHLFEIGGMMLIGMALYRWGVLSGLRSARFYLGLAIFGFLVGGWLRGAEVFAAYQQGFDPLLAARMDTLMRDLGRLPLALGHLGLIGLLCRWARAPRLTAALGATGRLALTHYITQTLFAITLFYGFGLGLFGQLERWQLALVCLGVWAFQIGLSVIWVTRYRYGPLEWVWRSLVFGRAQSLRKGR
jgi:uncharacterized protein